MDSPKKKKVEKPEDGRQTSGPDIGNAYHMEDNKAAPSAPPPWGSCCLAFGKDFLCFGLISGAHPEAFPHSFFGTVHLPWFSQPWQWPLAWPWPAMWENQGRWTVPKKRMWKSLRMGARNQAKTYEILTKLKTTRRRLRRRPLEAPPLGVLVVFHLVRISYVLA